MDRLWDTVFATADRAVGLAVDAPFESRVCTHLEPHQVAGYDVEVDAPHFVPLEIELSVCAEPGHVRSYVEAAILDRLTSGMRKDGTRGSFHPDRFTFAQSVYLSAIIAEVQNVPGVQSVTADKFQRLRDDTTDATDSGVLTMSRREIARLDADPNHPKRGLLAVEVGGGT